MKFRFVFLLGFLFTVTASAYSGSSGYAYVSGIRYNDTLAVRSAPSTRYYKVGDLAPGARGIRVIRCTYNDRGRKWCKVRHGRTLGWSYAKYLRSSGGNGYTPSAGWRARVTGIRYDDTLTMRDGPSTRYHRVGEIPPYAKNVSVYRCIRGDRGGRWCKVRYNGIIGWSSARYLRRR